MTPQVAAAWLPALPAGRRAAESRRLAAPLLGSLLLHALLLSLSFGGAGEGLPGFALPWKERRAAEPRLRIELGPAPSPGPALPALPPPAAPAVRATVGPEGTARTAAPAVPVPVLPQEPPAPPRADVPAEAPPETSPETPPLLRSGLAAAEAPRLRSTALDPGAPAHADALLAPLAPAVPAQAPRLLAVDAPSRPALRARAERLDLAPLDPRAAADASLSELAAQQARQRGEWQDLQRAEAERAEAQRLQAERAEAQRLQAERAEAQRLQVELAAARAAKAAQAAADEERREASRRAMGRQLDAEAAQRQAATQQAAPDIRPSSWSGTRRARLFGRVDPNAELQQVAEAFARRVQLNVPPQQVRELAARAARAPLVTVALRHDGTVESVVFVQSSGLPEVDEAVRRLVQSLAPYPAFPPLLASQLDVVEIRRAWVFSDALWLQ